MLNKIKRFYQKIIQLIQIPYNIFLEKFKKAPMVFDFYETIDIIIKDEKSISRFGDGELGIIQRNHSPGFQDVDKEMSLVLKEKLKNTDQQNLLICIPYVFQKEHLLFRTEGSKKWWESHLRRNRSSWYKYLDFNYHYGAASFTRYYMASEKKNHNEMSNYFNKIKQIWNGKKVLIVEGQLTRMGFGNDLFDNVEDLRRILGPKKNAFSRYNEILETTLSFLEENDDYIVVLALGPTASILAQDIAAKGFRALDMGHLDIEYEWFLNADKKTNRIKNKYVNEFSEDGGISSEILNDDFYQKQIITSIN